MNSEDRTHKTIWHLICLAKLIREGTDGSRKVYEADVALIFALRQWLLVGYDEDLEDLLNDCPESVLD